MINIIEIKQKMTQGKTEPWLCLGDDNNEYVVKRLNATFKGCVAQTTQFHLTDAILENALGAAN